MRLERKLGKSRSSLSLAVFFLIKPNTNPTISSLTYSPLIATSPSSPRIFPRASESAQLLYSLPRCIKAKASAKFKIPEDFAHGKFSAREGKIMAPLCENFRFEIGEDGAINPPLPTSPSHHSLSRSPSLSPTRHLSLLLVISNGCSPLRVDQLGWPWQRGGGGCGRVELRIRVGRIQPRYVQFGSFILAHVLSIFSFKTNLQGMHNMHIRDGDLPSFFLGRSCVGCSLWRGKSVN